MYAEEFEITKSEGTKRRRKDMERGKWCIVVACQRRGKWREMDGRTKRRGRRKGCVDLDAREKHHLSLTLCVSSLPLKAFLVLSRTVSFRIG